MDRFLCIHAHFYQPPRENPWLEAIELQEGAFPYHDWNQRITAECYAPNALSRLLDQQGLITQIVNNYSKISFNFGPTLLAWLQEQALDVYQLILQADQESQKRFSGHGSALAQAYNHMIMPLANHKDKYTQICWGIKDFQHRFGRMPEGMWLPETAVDLETLELMVELGIKFTILAPHQARRVRQIGTTKWKELSGEEIDTTQAYQVALPSGRRTSIFFYHSAIARAVAFERILEKGENLVGGLLQGFSHRSKESQLLHIATDGETYGHHHQFGDMALAYALHQIETKNLAKLTNYGEYLEKHPPNYEVEIRENTSWSCNHGLERWRKDCGCKTGEHPGWNQAWRAPLREALDWLRDMVVAQFESRAGEYFHDCWQARNDYIEMVLDRSDASLKKFLDRNCRNPLSESELTEVLKLLELQRQAILMYTSCGWFFDDISGIETVQVLRYAARVIQLAQELFDSQLETRFVELLSTAKSNLAERGNGGDIYNKYVKPARFNLIKVGAHCAMSSLFENFGERTKFYSYHVNREDHQVRTAGETGLASGKIKITSVITKESKQVCFGAFNTGNFDVYCGVRDFRSQQAYQELITGLSGRFSKGDVDELKAAIDHNFGSEVYTLKNLLRDEQEKIIARLLESDSGKIESACLKSIKESPGWQCLLAEVGRLASEILKLAAQFVFNSRIRRLLKGGEVKAAQVTALVESPLSSDRDLGSKALALSLQSFIESSLQTLAERPEESALLGKIQALLECAGQLETPPNLWRSQNIFYQMLLQSYPAYCRKAKKGDRKTVDWVEKFREVGRRLSIRV